MADLDTVDKFSLHKKSIWILVLLTTVAFSFAFSSAVKSSGSPPNDLWLSAGIVVALLVALLISIGRLIKAAEKSVRDLQLANEEYQDESEERKWAEVMLQESRVYAESIVETIAEPVMVLDANLRVIKTNTSFYDTFKAQPEDTLNESFFNLGQGQWHLPELVDGLQEIIPEGTQIDGYEFTKKFAGIGERTISLNARRIYRKETVTNLILITMQDITEQKRAEQELARRAEELSRSNTELEQFAYIASHDLQEPLRMVSSYCQMLQRRYHDKLDSDATEFIDFAVSGAKQMQALINDLLLYSRVGTQEKRFAETDCNAVLDQVKKNLRMAIDESQAVVKHDPLPIAVADDSQLVQLFQNLIGNAIKFKGEETPEICVEAESRNGDWVFSVADNGVGIDADFEERIFVIFQRLHTKSEYPGTGIGLSICKKIVERHGGRIWVDSQPGKGSKFYFTLPKTGVGQHATSL